jgi:predicted nucleic acid-binding protein
VTTEPRGVIDTNVVILLPQITDPSVLPEEPTITTITLAELSVGPLVAADSRERAARQAQLQQAESDFVPLAFDEAAARAFGRVAADLRASGRKPTARAFDALIAATAIANGLALYTTNPSDFEAISGLELRTVPHPDAMVSGSQPE